MKNHQLKIHPEYFNEVVSGNKTFEIRLNDRNYEVGDTFDLLEHDGSDFTGNSASGKIKYIFSDSKFGLQPEHCVFSFDLNLIML
jgi:hypothetical protein